MIDTVAFLTSANDKCIEELKKGSLETTRINHNDQSIELNYFNTRIDLPSYDRKLTIFMDEIYNHKIRFELSIPKFIYGHNLFLITEKEFHKAIIDLYNLLKEKFPSFPHYSLWHIKRLDICYAWRFENNDTATLFLNNIKHYHLPKHRNINYETSFMSKSQNVALKMYLKNREFLKHDYPILYKSGYTTLADEIMAASIGVLRFEVGLRKEGLKVAFNKKIVYIRDINFSVVFNLLQKYFYKMFPVTTINNRLSDYDKLLITFKASKALRLYSYLTLLNNADPKLIEMSLSRRQIMYNNADLKKAGIFNQQLDLLPKQTIDFNIPSKNTIKTYLISDTVAPAQRGN